MKAVRNRLHIILLPLASCGFAVAQPVYDLLLQTPVFLLARQNQPEDIWALSLVLSFLLPLALALPAWLAWRRWPAPASLWCWIISSGFAALFSAQLLQESLGGHWVVFLGLTIVTATLLAWALLFTRWSILTTWLAIIALLFPAWFLLFSPALERIDHFAAAAPERQNIEQTLPEIVFVVLDELPLATLLDGNHQIDRVLFPNFARLKSMSNWYYDTTTVSDNTIDAVPSILTGRYPGVEASELTIAAQPINLFTHLRHFYRFNVAEAVTRLCPQTLCPRSGPDRWPRLEALLLDVAAIYLHRVVPDRWVTRLPVVSNNWSGFFAERQVFFPDGWLKHAGAQTEIDRPAFFRLFIDSIYKDEKPALNFMHILFPHEPNAYLPDGRNYGLQWMRGQFEEQWHDVEWGVISGKQRHYLQVQFADRLLGELLDRMALQGILNDSLMVVVADHGISFALGGRRRALSASNAAEMLRVPMFIKYPGQTHGERIDTPAMTVDILPTVLAALGLSLEQIQTDGVDLASPARSEPRTTLSNSHRQRELKEYSEAQLDIGGLVAQNRTQLHLDDPDGALWQIGPFDEYRGQPMDIVCDGTEADVEAHFDGYTELPAVTPEDSIRAYLAGHFSGDAAVTESKPFLITSNGIIVASGHTWPFREYPRFFALVEPKYVSASDWAPEAWLLDGRKCLGQTKAPPRDASPAPGS